MTRRKKIATCRRSLVNLAPAKISFGFVFEWKKCTLPSDLFRRRGLPSDLFRWGTTSRTRTTSCLLPRALAGSLLVPCSCLAKTPPAQMVSPAAAPGDGAPDSKDHSAVIKMNQHTRLSQARSEEPAPIKLNDQHNTHPMTVRAHNGRRAVP